MAGMADHPHTIDRWDDATGENLVEQIAAVGDYLVALETYRAAVKRWPKDKITLRNRARNEPCPTQKPTVRLDVLSMDFTALVLAAASSSATASSPCCQGYRLWPTRGRLWKGSASAPANLR
jgi:hypothetical protein